MLASNMQTANEALFVRICIKNFVESLDKFLVDEIQVASECENLQHGSKAEDRLYFKGRRIGFSAIRGLIYESGIREVYQNLPDGSS